MAGFCHKLYEIRLRILSNTSKINDGVRQIKCMRVPSGRENEMKPAKVFVEKMYMN